jgi:hypothetical protein
LADYVGCVLVGGRLEGLGKRGLIRVFWKDLGIGEGRLREER